MRAALPERGGRNNRCLWMLGEQLGAGDAERGGVNPVGKGLPESPLGECTHWGALGELGNVGCVCLGWDER